MAERKGHGALPMAIDILTVHFHGGAVPQHPFDHGGDFGGRTRFQLGVDTRRFAFHGTGSV